MGQVVFELLAAKREVRRLEGYIAELLTEIETLKSEVEETPKPSIKLFSVTGLAVDVEIKRLGLVKMYPTLLDFSTNYFFTDAEGWAEVFNYIYCEFDMPPYLSARMDCEDFALLLKGLVSSLFGLNFFAFIIGDSPGGKHAFNLFRIEGGYLLFEPQLGTFFEIGEKGYKPEWVLV